MTFWEKIVSGMSAFWEQFVNNTGLVIVRTLAFLVLGLVVIRIVQIIARSASLKSRKLDRAASTFVLSILTVVLYIALVIVLVSSLGFSTTGIIAALSAVALAVALALKDSLGSLANGVIIIFTKPFKKGDYVQIGDYDGLVQDIRLFNTKILTYDNVEVIIPNSDILSSEMVNYSTMPLRRVVIDVPVPYDADIAAVKATVLNSLTSYRYSVSQPSPSVVLKAYKDSALLFSARVWTQNEHYWDTLNDLYEIIFLDLHANGIDIPFNRLDVALLPSTEAEGADGKGARKAAVAVRGMNENTREDKKK